MMRRKLLGIAGATAIGMGLLIGLPARGVTGPVDLVLGGDTRIDGAAAYDQIGYALSPSGDVNADGVQDFLIGAYNASSNTLANSGSTYVVFGGDLPRVIDLADLGTHGFRVDGAAAEDYSGIAVADAGDVNADGKDDILIGAAYADPSGRTGAGSAYVVFGKSTTSAVQLGSLGDQGFRIDGAATYDGCGLSVAGLGDMNGDGKDDLLVGSPYADPGAASEAGSAHMIYGKSGSDPVDLAALGVQGFRIDGADAGDLAGGGVVGPGDINRDGVPDMLVGAYGADHNGRTSSGSAYVVFGAAAGSDRDLATLGSGGFVIDGPVPDGLVGLRLAAGGDLNFDGVPDILIGVPEESVGSLTGAGIGYVVYGKGGTGAIDLAALGAAGTRLLGDVAAGRAGVSLAAAGDFDGDGGPDLVIGAPYLGMNDRVISGSAYVVKGPFGSGDVVLSGDRVIRYDGAATMDTAGVKVAGVGDVTGDRGVDILIAAPSADNNTRTSSGSVYLIRGTPRAPVAATLTVQARKATKTVRRTGRTVLVRNVSVGAGQAATITVKAPKRVRVTKTATTVKVRTRKAPRTRIVVRITASGEGFTPVTWSRRWKIR